MARSRDLDLLQRIGSRIRARRIAKGLTQERLAEACSMQAETISRVENGRVSADIATLVRLANKLDLDVGQLVQVAGAGPERPEEVDPLSALSPSQRDALRGFVESMRA